ncbi:glycoside hydrolase family 172 protein [Pseudochryseolinea flava]|uniref:DUF2961 domain-containing protein n=1 Tax=Pseudochryseolinea flava TaxID=2059302 RepID=A0A364Y3A2_9BACT|nr:glycoside hydrolase family 172 protein [Pseudochryseolinea flava]RAW00824.1 DUF2961 domain-containing protein [Pseudochryseolinea flava]
MCRSALTFLTAMLVVSNLHAQQLYKVSPHESRWASFENAAAEKANGGKENKHAKGHPAEFVVPGEKKTLLDVKGAGIIQRIWLTVNDRSPAMLRALRIEIFWDNATKPAVSAPLGDFFGTGLARRTSFQSALFTDPEGRSFNCYIPMPYRSAAKIVLTNEGNKQVHLFYDVNFQKVKSHADDVLYFHAYWSRNTAPELGKDFVIIPKISGRGRYLGMNMGVITNPLYEKSWWGEGEVKIYLDGDGELPTLNGTGTEDYIGTAWGQGAYNHLYQGCLVADEANRQWSFYRYHVPDPVYFQKDCQVTIQLMGGDMMPKVRSYVEKGAKLIPVTVHGKDFIKLLEQNPIPQITDKNFPDGWTNFYRSDDVSATGYFYLDKPFTSLPPLPPVEERVMYMADKQ